MLLLILGLLIFLGVHSIVIFAPNFRAKYRQKHLLVWKAIYGLLSILGFALIVIGYGEARYSPIVLYRAPFELRYVTSLLMIPFFILFFTPFLQGKISSMIYRFTKHPQLLSIKFFAMSHLLVNGTLADIFLFGGLLVWAILDVIALNRLPKDNPPNQSPRLKYSFINDIILLGLSIGLYIGFLFVLHYKLIGIPLL